MQVVAEYRGRSEFEVMARTHKVVCDQPLESNGSDAGMTPPEFLLASLATCAGYYAAQYLNTRRLPSANLKVKVTAEKALNPARLGRFAIEITVPGLEERHRDGVLRAARACLIHNTLLHSPAIDISVNPDEGVADFGAKDSPATLQSQPPAAFQPAR